MVATAAGNPAKVIGPLKDAGIKVIHVVANVSQAVKVERAGVDAIVAEGGESGGLVAGDRVSTLVLVPAVADAVKVPVIAAGGIADARGLVAAMALGAKGVQIGTRFLVTPECEAADQWKEGIIRAKDTDTQVVQRGSAQARTLKDEVQPGVMSGIVAALINDIKTVKEIIDDIAGEAQGVLKNIEKQL